MTFNVTIDNDNDTFLCVASTENTSNLGFRDTVDAATSVLRDVAIWTSDPLAIHTTTRQPVKYL